MSADPRTARPGPAPLADLRVLEITQGVAGPLTGRMLSQLGARVVKIERPGIGDLVRLWDSHVHGLSSGHAWVNAGKESVCLDLTTPDGRDAALRLAAVSDVVVENLVPGRLELFGLGPEALAAANPNLILCRISGFGQTGPYADRPALDLIMQGEAGLILTNGTEEQPAKLSLSVCDISGAMYSTIAILAAARRPHRDAIEVIDVPIFDTVLTWTGYFPFMQWYSGREPGRVGLNHHTMYPYGVYTASDGKQVALVGGAGGADQWNRFIQALDRVDELSSEVYCTNEGRMTNREAIEPVIVGAMLERTADEWVQRLLDHDLPGGRVNSIAEALDHPCVAHRGLITEAASAAGSIKGFDFPVQFSSLGKVNELGPPTLGEHTDTVLAELGYSAEEVAGITGVPVGQPASSSR